MTVPRATLYHGTAPVTRLKGDSAIHHRRSLRFILFAALASVLSLCLLPIQAALAGGGCCFTKVSITSLDTGRVAVLTGPSLTAGYDVSTFWSFADFAQPAAKPARSGPAYEVNRDGWDHLRYYPSAGGAPGVVYYEGLYNGSSEYDHQWFVVPPEQDAALRQVMQVQGLTGSTAQQQWFLVGLVFVLFAGALLAVYLALGAYLQRPQMVSVKTQV